MGTGPRSSRTPPARPARCERERAPHLGGTEGEPVPRSCWTRRAARAVSSPDLDALAADLEARVRRAIREELAAAGDRPPAGPSPLLDLAGTAARLNVSERTVESLVASGEIPVVRIGTGRGVRRFDPASVEAFIRRRARAL